MSNYVIALAFVGAWAIGVAIGKALFGLWRMWYEARR